VREFRDGLLNDLGRVHGEITGLLERTFTERKEALGAAGADAKAVAAADAKAKKRPSRPGSPSASSSPPVRLPTSPVLKIRIPPGMLALTAKPQAREWSCPTSARIWPYSTMAAMAILCQRPCQGQSWSG
jgi:hypothetical protein